MSHIIAKIPSAETAIRRITVLDSHTAGEPTRLVVDGGPDLGGGALSRQLQQLRNRHPEFRTAVLKEPRGSDVLVGGLLCPPSDPASTAAVIFFNDVGYLGMCGHGTIGLMHSLAHLGRIRAGEHLLETPVGNVRATLHPDGSVTVANVPSYRYAAGIVIEVPGFGAVTGDIAWGGNWFFLVGTPAPLPLALANVDELTRLSIAVRQALANSGATGAAGAPIDHIEWFSAPHDPANHSRNFVLCPGTAYDRSPCGTGTSAKLAVLAARNALKPGEPWRQEGILGTVFTGSYEPAPEPQPDGAQPDGAQPDGAERGSPEAAFASVLPRITGRAWVSGETTLLFEAGDPFADGITTGTTRPDEQVSR